MPMAKLDWRPRPADERTFRAALARVRRYWQRNGFDAQCPVAWQSFCDDPAAALVDHAEDYRHPSGTTRMGTDPAASVVGPDLNCHDVANLSVASASVFPAAGSANPTLTIMALALRLGDRLLAERPRPVEVAVRAGAGLPASPNVAPTPLRTG
jgi:choline dehydrogenase-like flavoprotein